MSFMDEYNALKKKRKNEDAAASSGKTSGNSFMSEYNKLKSQRDEQADLSAYRKIVSNYALNDTYNTLRMLSDKKAEADKRTWFQSGEFDDGYQFGDVTKTILGTASDTVQELVEGVVDMGEKAVDAGAYILGAVGGVFGADGFKDDMADFIAKDLYDAEDVVKFGSQNALIPSILGALDTDEEEASVLGEKSEGLLNSAGQMVGTAGLQAVGVPWFVTTGVTSFGGEAENALNEGATFEEAGVSALVSAGSEILTEKLFGGSGLGEKGLVNLDGLTKGISNKLVKALADYGVDMAAEGAEEVVSEFAGNLASSLYKEENLGELLFSEEAVEGYIDSFISGAAISGGMNAGKVTSSVKTGKDYRTGMTDNEQKVFDKVYNDRIAEAEKDGKITGKEKAKIYDKVLDQMEKGYIDTDTIEEVLGGELYKAYKDTIDSEDALQKEFDELGKKQNATLAEQARYNELSQQIKDLQTNSQRNQLKSVLSQEVSDFVASDRLSESYNERARRGQAYQADLTQYDTKQQAVIQKAVDSGILNNTRRAHEFVDMVAKISADKGVLFDFTDNAKLKDSGFAVDGKFVNGYVTKDGITVNIDSSKSLNSIVGHEITHVLEGTEVYDALKKTLFDYAKSKGDYQGRYDSLSSLYQNVKDADVEAELAADLAGDYLFTDSDFIRHLSTNNRNVFQKIWDEIKYLYKVATAGSKEARELEKVKKAFEDAYRAEGKAEGDTKYSLSDSDGKQLSKEQQEYFKDSKMRDENGNLKVMYHGSQDAGFHVFYARMSDDDTSFFFVDRNDVAASYSGTTETYEAQTIRTAEDMNKFIESIGVEGYEVVEQDGKFTLMYEGDRVADSDTAQGIYDEFCWYEGVGEGDANYKVYLNLTNPLEVDAQGRPWNKIDAEFSQEVYDKYQSLTADEKAALVDLAGWEDFRIFNSEIQEARGNELESAYQKMGEDVNIYDLFSVAADNFSEEAMRENARKYLKTRDYAQRAKEQGYDGVIFKNIVDNGGYSNGSEGASTVAIAFNSNQIKSTANAKPTGDADIRYSLSDSNGRELSKEQAEYFKDSKAKDENGSLKVVYHGTRNADFTVFKRNVNYFTDSKEMADSYSPNGDMYEGYVNITKPYEIDAAGEKWSRIPIDDATRKFLQEYGASVFKEGGKWRTTPADLASAIEEAVDNGDMDYDGIIIRNVDDTGSYYKGNDTHVATDYIVFNSNQFKNTDNKNPTSDPDIRFSLSESVEETKDLMALHNLTEAKLLKSLKLGGLPMPSVAIAKAKDGHGEFGEISLILPKETIDPKANARNKLYSGDAWTPTYPKVEYKLNTKALKAINKKIDGLVPYEVQDFGRLHLDPDNMEDTLNRYSGNMVDAFKDNDALKYAYLMEAGADITLPMKEKNLSYHGSRENGAIIKVAEAISADEISKALNGGYEEAQKLEPIVRKAVAEYVRETYGDDQFILDTFAPEEGLSFSDLDGYLTEARKYHRTGIEKTVDSRPARELIRDMTVQYSYEEWLKNLFSGIVEKEGIRNNQDYFTPSGNRRSFEALHYEHNLENVIKAMREKGEKGIGFGGGSIFGASTTEFSSIEDMKQSGERLRKMSDEEYQEIRDEFSNRFFELAKSLPDNKNSFMAADDAATALTEAVAKYKTRSGIANYLRRELKGWATYSDQVVDDLIELVNDIRKMPTGYFEAKPQRAVGFDEVGVFVIPRNADVKLKQELLNRGYSIAEYDPDVEGDRQKVVNQFEEYKFSLSNVGEQHKAYGNYNVYGKDIRLDKGDVAPVAETTAETKTPVSQTKVDISEKETTTEELFPDTPMQSLDELMAEAQDIMGAMEAYEAIGDRVTVEKLLPEYEAVMEKIGQLEQADRQRVDSLSEAEVPPEMEAPYYGKSQPVRVDDPFENREWYDIGNRKVKAYMYENPEVKPFFQEEALKLMGELNDTTKGERWYNDEVYYESGGEKGFGGVKRHTSASMEELLDQWHMSYADIEKGLNAIIKDNGAENIAAAKKLEFMLNDRLMHGYKDFYTNKRIPPNQDYIELLNEKQITEYSKEAFDYLVAHADEYAPPVSDDVAPVQNVAQKPEVDAGNLAPTADVKTSKGGEVAGQQAMYQDAIRNESGKTAKILIGQDHVQQKKQSGLKWANEHIFRHGAVFEDLSLATGNRELQARFDNIRRAESRAQTFIGNGKNNVSALLDVKKAVDSAGKTEAFNEYLYHMHNVDRMTLEERFKDTPNKSVFGDAVTAEVSRKAAAKLLKENPEFKQYAEEIYGINKYLRGMMVDEGIISKETADLWQTMYPHYVPISRVGHEGLNVNVPLDTNRTGVNAPIKKATGGNSDIYDVFETMGSRISQTYKAIAKNRFGTELKNTLGTVIENEAAGGVDEVLDSVDKHDELLQEGKDGQKPTFTVFENGERVKFEITDEMYEAMKPSQFTYTNKALNKVGNVRRDILTTYSPTFAVTNPIKDIGDILVNSQHPARTYASIPEAIKSVIKKDHWYQERMENGGDQDTYFDSQTKTYKKEPGKFGKIVGFPFEKIRQVNEAIEQIPRMAEYIASRKMGRSIDVSMLDAARVTTNFGAAGDFTNMLNRNGFTFLGASVEGFNQQVRNVREAKAEGLKGWGKLAGKYLAAGLPALLLNHMLWDDDEEYAELSDYVKQNYYIVGKFGDGKFLRIPKGRAVAVIQDAFQQMENLITGNDDVDLESFGQLVLNNLAPNNPLDNNILSPLVQTFVTEETWYGDDLVPTRLQDMPAAEQYDETTDAISKWLGETFDISPYKVNYLLDQYSGGIGDIALPYLTPEADGGGFGAAFRDKFTTDSVMKNQNVSDFYDKMDELTVNANSMYATDEDILMSKYMSSVNSKLSELYQQKREIQNSGLSDKAKNAKIREIQQQIVDLTKEGLNSYEDVSIEGVYATVGDQQFRWYEPGEDSNAEPGWKKLTAEQIEKQDEVTGGLGISPSEYWSNKGEYDFAYEYPEKYEFLKENGVTYDDYKNGNEDFKDAWTWASKNPEKFTMSKAIASDVVTYRKYTGELYDIKADKDEDGKSISGSRKEKVIDYINNMDADYGEKIVLFKSEYPADDTYNYEIIDYLNSREDISYEEMETILKELGFTVKSDGTITWD
jgi:DNA-binding ferritin-like protein (Dps family)